MFKVIFLYFITLAFKDYKYREVSYLDVFLLSTISSHFVYNINFYLFIFYLIICVIWVYIETIIYKEEFFFPMGIVDMFYIVIILCLIFKGHSKELYILPLGLISTLISTYFIEDKNKIPYLFVLAPIALLYLLL